ncbi:AfsA-related hotdog domain-containing protein [Microbacterium rhizomatis]|uniref:A-factor biosynthesis hotdog domain-containing protein n=1 Tax=Microbacterium rhizomatis TaxID=1631477 RepID=A0A5J5J2I6_9MICO|nr:AfsA-related hotdog domain-containing protein [Microbacterium rhizomatis]KAA9108254.1 hypothetical protein F6B43_12725 [Microbacterium rhizomatis]
MLEVQRTVDRSLVHKLAVSEVLITDWTTVDGSVWVAAQWPRRHWFFGEPHLRLDPVLVMETFRQAWVLVAHTSFGVPLSSHVVMEEHGLRIDKTVASSDPKPPTVWLKFSTLHAGRSAGAGSSLQLSAEIFVAGVAIAHAWGKARLVTKSVYERMRRRPPRADLVAQFRWPSERCVVAFDTRHPVFFDHPNDHVPGMLLISAACDAVRSEDSIRQIRARFIRYFELNSTISLERATTEPGSVVLRFYQLGTCGGEVEICW